MGKKKKKGGGGCQQENAAEERDDKACADADNKGDDADSGCEDKGKDQKDKDKAPDGKEKDKDKAPDGKEKDKGGCKDQKEKEKEKAGKAKEKKPPLPVVTAVLKVDMHCDGCAARIRASVRRFPGVEGVAMEVDKGSMTVVGRFDAKKLRDRVAKKTRKTVDLAGGANNNNNNKGGGQKCADGEAKPEKKDEEEDGKCAGGGGNAGKGKGGKDAKKPAVPVIATVVLKVGSVGLHCDGCMRRIRCKLFKIKGVEQVVMEFAKNQVTVTGTMDGKALPEKLRKKVRRPVDAVPPGKDKDKDKQGEGGGNKEDGKQQQQQGGGKQSKEAAELELWKTAFFDQQAMQAAQFMLSDENPNACAVM